MLFGVGCLRQGRDWKRRYRQSLAAAWLARGERPKRLRRLPLIPPPRGIEESQSRILEIDRDQVSRLDTKPFRQSEESLDRRRALPRFHLGQVSLREIRIPGQRFLRDPRLLAQGSDSSSQGLSKSSWVFGRHEALDAIWPHRVESWLRANLGSRGGTMPMLGDTHDARLPVPTPARARVSSASFPARPLSGRCCRSPLFARIIRRTRGAERGRS